MKYPFKKYLKKDLINEYNILKNKLNEYNPNKNIKYSRIGLKCSNNFFQYERIKTPSQGKISCYDYWKKNYKKVIEYHNKSNSNSDLFATIIFLNHGPSQFPTFIAGQIYKKFNASKILDPFAGWGDRCLAAMSLNLDYTGIDLNSALKPYYKNMIDYYDTKSKIKMYFKNCMDVDLNKIDFDFVLTSPPYWSKDKKLLEKYNKTDDDYDFFMNSILIPFIIKCKRKNSDIVVCINMPEMMYNDVKKEIGKCNRKITFTTHYNSRSKNTNKNKKFIYCF